MWLKQTLQFILFFSCFSVCASFNIIPQKGVIHSVKNSDTTIQTKPYTNLVYQKSENLIAASGTKSVIFNSIGSKLYAMNLEGMSVYEFDQSTRKITREFKFKPTKGTGWDYVAHVSVPSYEEKPVEACFSHNDSILWVSLHNAGGIVPINIYEKTTITKNNSGKKVYVINEQEKTKDSIYVPLIKTGKTPKVIARTGDNKFLLVSNWHSNNVSVIEINDTLLPYGKLKATIPVVAIPRGIAIDDINQKSYIAIMGGNSISVVNNSTWKIEKELQVASTPRHIVMDNEQRLFVSFNSIGKIACINPSTGKTLFTAATNAQPRTIALSRNQQFLFVTCYTGNTVDVFKINKTSFTKLYTLDCKGKPVGVDIYEDDAKLEAWVCNYVGGSLKVFTFKKQ
jgi:DNA-binding beta-propeller fold protein YncE